MMPIPDDECARHVAATLREDTRCRVLKEAVDQAVGGLRFECRKCSSEGAEGGARALLMAPVPEPLIVLCSNRLSSKAEVPDAVRHELIHAFDFYVRRLDLYRCDTLAYSEVRAAREAECDPSMSVLYRAPIAGAWFLESCIRERATAATSSIFPREEAERSVTHVYRDAIKDRSPLAPCPLEQATKLPIRAAFPGERPRGDDRARAN